MPVWRALSCVSDLRVCARDLRPQAVVAYVRRAEPVYNHRSDNALCVCAHVLWKLEDAFLGYGLTSKTIEASESK